MTKGFITKSMLDNLNYDSVDKEMSATGVATQADAGKSATAVIVFAGGDLNAAAYHLTKAMQNPFAADAVASLFVQESVLDDFVGIIKSALKPPRSEVSQHEGYKKAMQIVKQLHLKTLESSGGGGVASIVFDATQEQLSANNGPTGLVTLHTFRTAKEAIGLVAKETVTFANISIWHQNHSCAYELVSNLHARNFFINCFQVSVEPIAAHIEKCANFLLMDKSYHYETMQHNGAQKTIVFPIGTIFAN